VDRTPVVVVAGQELTDQICERLLRTHGTLVVQHRYDGQVVVRSVRMGTGDRAHTSEWPMELMDGCADCMMRDDLLILLRRLHRREDVSRIVVHLEPWLEPEPICWAINNVEVHVGPGYIDGPAARDVRIEAVISTVATEWLTDALSADELEDGRTVAQVVVGQAEFADILSVSTLEPRTQAVLCRLAPRAPIIVGNEGLDRALDGLNSNCRRGGDHNPHAPLLDGQPPLDADCGVKIVEFVANRPFHPMRLHLAIDELLDGVVRIKGRAWLASQPDVVIWLESAGGGLKVGHAGPWLASMSSEERAEADTDRVALASLRWDTDFGDREISMTALVCGADPDDITRALTQALLTDDELAHPADWAGYDDPFGDWHEDPCDDLGQAEDCAAGERPQGDIAER
jgi:G3E family GTPase